MIDPAVLVRKLRGEICLRAGCLEENPRHAVVWKCPAGHRETLWYCAEHGPEMMAVLTFYEGSRRRCGMCVSPAPFMYPLLED